MFELWRPPPENPPAPVQPFGLKQYSLVVLAASAILVAREPHKLLHPQFIAEDGSIFFAQAFNEGPWTPFLTPYAGYYHLIPRLLAAVGMYLPYASIPLFYSLTALLLTALALTWFYLPQHRCLVQSDTLRLAAVLLFLCAPNLAALMQIAYVQWPLAVWALLVALTPLPAKRWPAWATGLCYLLVIGTAPVVIVWLPVWLWRLYCCTATPPQPSPVWGGSRWLDRRRFFFYPFTVPSPIGGGLGWGQQFTQLLCITLAHGLVVYSALTNAENAPVASQTLWLRLLDFGRGFVYQAGVLNLLGRVGSEWLLARLGWWAFYAIGLGLLGAVLLALRWQNNPTKRFVSCLLLYVGLAASLLYLNRAALYEFMFANNLATMHQSPARYFWIPSVAGYVFGMIQLDGWLTSNAATGRALFTSAGYWLLLGLYSFSFYIGPWGNIAWAPQARLLAQLQGQAQPCQPTSPLANPAGVGIAPKPAAYPIFLPFVFRAHLPVAGYFLVNLPIVPAGWVMSLSVPDKYIQRSAIGLTLLGAEDEIVGQMHRLRLFWQADSMVARADSQYQIVVHLVDSQGRRLTKDDTAVAQVGRDSAEVAAVFQSQHSLVLPPDSAPGNYHWAVVLRAQQAQSVNLEEYQIVERRFLNCVRAEYRSLVSVSSYD